MYVTVDQTGHDHMICHILYRAARICGACRNFDNDAVGDQDCAFFNSVGSDDPATANAELRSYATHK